MNRWFDCQCEDFPCCGHYDTGYQEEDYEPDLDDYNRGWGPDDDESDDEDLEAFR